MMGDLNDTIVFPSVKERVQFLSDPKTNVKPQLTTESTSNHQADATSNWVKFGESKEDDSLNDNRISQTPCSAKKPPPIPSKPIQFRTPLGKNNINSNNSNSPTNNMLCVPSSPGSPFQKKITEHTFKKNVTPLTATNLDPSDSYFPAQTIKNPLVSEDSFDFERDDPFADDNATASLSVNKHLNELKTVLEPKIKPNNNVPKNKPPPKIFLNNINNRANFNNSSEPKTPDFCMRRHKNTNFDLFSEDGLSDSKPSNNLIAKKPPLPPKSPNSEAVYQNNVDLTRRASPAPPLDIKKESSKPQLPPKPVEKPSLPPKPSKQHARCVSEGVVSASPPRVPAKPYSDDRAFPDPFIDSMHPSRLPPCLDFSPILTKGNIKSAAICGKILLVGDHGLRGWDISSGVQIIDLCGPSDHIKTSSIAFLPSRKLEDEGWFAWYANTEGQLNLLDIANGKILDRRASLHSYSVNALLRFHNSLLTFDESGAFNIWSERCDSGELLSSINFERRPKTAKIPYNKGDLITIACNNLWVASHRSISIYQITSSAPRINIQEVDFGDGVITCIGASEQLGWVIIGHQDGKITIWDIITQRRLGAAQLAPYRVNSLIVVLDRYLWVAVTNKLFVYDLLPPNRSPGSNVWVLRKEFIAHDEPISHLIADPVGLLSSPNYTVVSICNHGLIKFWDGILSEDWQTKRLESSRENYCLLREVKIRVCSWNIDASKPADLLNHPVNARFLEPWLCPKGTSPDLIVIGFQETVDLESKKVTAKSIFRKKDETGEHITQRYNKWQQRLTKALHKEVSGTCYKLVECQNLVGLFTCIFIKESELTRLHGIEVSTTKTGFGGLHGNKGAIAVRFTWDDTSLCFVNCHLAAGQSQISARNNDVNTILKKTQLSTLRLTPSALFKANRNHPPAFEVAPLFVGGGDGQRILDHEICIFSGDLNYRIDLPRDHIEELIRAKEWELLREYDQLYQLRKGKVPFMLRLFHEPPIQFAPTYKYDPYTDQYDTSEKRRLPAWCDRILFRGSAIEVADYNRFECNASDHRPIAASFVCLVKTILPDKYRMCYREASDAWSLRCQTHISNHLNSHLLKLGYSPGTISLVMKTQNLDPAQIAYRVYVNSQKLPKLTYE